MAEFADACLAPRKLRSASSHYARKRAEQRLGSKGEQKGNKNRLLGGTEVAMVGGRKQEQKSTPQKADSAGGVSRGPLSTLNRKATGSGA